MKHLTLSTFLLLFVCIIYTSSISSSSSFTNASSSSSNNKLDTNRRLHFAVFSVPFYGHFLPIKSIAEQLVLQGHYVTVFAENMAWCESTARRPAQSKNNNNNETNNNHRHRDALRCIDVPKSGTFNHSMFEAICTIPSVLDATGFHRLFEELAMHQKFQLKPIFDIARKEHLENPFDAVLYDMSTFVGADVAAGLGGLPKIAVFPLVLTLASAGVTPAVPPHGLGFPRNMSFGQRAFSSLQGWLTPLAAHHIIQKVHDNRVESGIPELANTYYHDVYDFAIQYEPVIAPTIWGHDIGMPVCPNIKPVGILEALPAPNTELEPELEELLTTGTCKDKERIYINFGTLSVMNERMFTNLTQGVKMLLRDEETPTCVIWKLRADHEVENIKQLVAQKQIPNADRLFVRKRFNDPQKILPLVDVFVSHCGDTSVGEAINKLTPVAGLPFFADQIDVCMRMQERGFGVLIGDKYTFTGQTVVDAVRSIGRKSPRRKSVEKAIKEVRDVAQWLGGAPEAARWAADIIQKNISRAFHCRHFNPNAFKHEIEGTWGAIFQKHTFTFGNPFRIFTQVLSASDFDLHAISGLVLLFWISRMVGWLRRVLFGGKNSSNNNSNNTKA